MNPIYISEKHKVQVIVDKMVADGPDHLHFISDFDRTLTKAHNGREKIPSFVAILRHLHILGEDFSRDSQKLFERYHPIEASTSLDRAAKKDAMDEWWELSSQLLVKYGLSKKDIHTAIDTRVLALRGYAKESFAMMHKAQIPMIIMSASPMGGYGIGHFLEDQDVDLEHIMVVSNEFVWDKAGKAVDTVKPHIHTLNKNEASLVYYADTVKAIQKRQNVILLGDSTNDPDMLEGAVVNASLKVGFYNQETDDDLEYYMTLYDVVITGDGNMNYTHSLLIDILK